MVATRVSAAPNVPELRVATSIDSLVDAPERLLSMDQALSEELLAQTKILTDPLARARGLLDELYIRDMHLDQIWQQIKMLTEQTAAQVLEADLSGYEKAAAADEVDSDQEESDGSTEGDSEPFDEVFMNSDVDQEDLEPSNASSDLEGIDDISEDTLEEESVGSEFVNDLENDHMQFEGDDDDVEDDLNAMASREISSDSDLGEEQDIHKVFFNPDEVTRQVENMDEEDPFSDGRRRTDRDKSSRGGAVGDENEEEATDEEIDLDNFDVDDLDDEADPADLKYEDFFAPPPGRRRERRQQYQPHRRRAQREEPEEDDPDIDADDTLNDPELENEAMRGVQMDLFEVDNDQDESGDEIDESIGGHRRGNLSKHARRQQQLAAEIRALEAENVAPKSWQMSGEAQARSRPVDSLLEAPVEFEGNKRPVPVITEEVVQDLEQLIKQRIVADNFDTVVRKVPELAGHARFKQSADFELSDQKSQKSLAQLYEDEFADSRRAKTLDDAEQGPDAGSKVSEAERKEIEQLWKEASYALDSLSSWHYTPRPPAEAISIVTDAAAIAMEDQQPLALNAGVSSTLAPQEQYTAKAERSEVLGKDGLPISRSEMSVDQKRRQRRREKERRRKQTEAKNLSATINGRGGISKKKQDEQGLGKMIKRGDVKVIGKDGVIKGSKMP
ncbi:U3 snoRNP protein [Savitreella phatthalungensis]